MFSYTCISYDLIPSTDLKKNETWKDVSILFATTKHFVIMRFAFTIWFRVFFYYIVYLAPFSSNKPSLYVAADHQSFGINICFFYVWKLARINRHLFRPWILFPFRKQGSVFDHCLRVFFFSLFTKGYTCIYLFTMTLADYKQRKLSNTPK